MVGNLTTKLLSAYSVNSQMIDLHHQNIISGANPSSSLRTMNPVLNVVNGEVVGISPGPIVQNVNNLLIGNIRSSQSSLGSMETLKDQLDLMMTWFGPTGQQYSFAHYLGEMANSIKTLSTQNTAINQAQCLNTISKFVGEINYLDTQEISARNSCIRGITQDVQQINAILQQIVDLNNNIKVSGFQNTDSAVLKDQRRAAGQELCKLMDANIIEDSNGIWSIYTTQNSYPLLVNTDNLNLLSFTPPASATPGVAFPPIMLAGIDITNEIQGGELHGFLASGNTILPNFRNQITELVKTIRDNVNAIYNTGTSLNPIPTLTGTVGVPGILSLNLGGTDVISGNGTLRIGVIDPTTKALASHADIALQPNQTMTQLMTAINTSGAGVTATIVGGALQIASNNPLFGVAMGSVDGQPVPTINAGGAHNPATALGFSHFFGLRNLFKTGTFVCGQTDPTLPGLFSIDPSLIGNPQRLAGGVLTSSNPIATVAVAPRDQSIMLAIEQGLRNHDVPMNGGTNIGIVTGNIIDFGAKVIADLAMITTNNKNNHAKEFSNYQEMSSLAQRISGIDYREEMISIQQKVMLNTLLQKALSLALRMQTELANSLGN